MAGRGIDLTAFVIAVTLAGITLGAMGWYSVAGVDLRTGLQDDVQTGTDRLASPEASAVGTESPGFFGIAVGASETIATILSVTYKLQGWLQSLGLHWSIAYSFQAMTDYTVGITLLSIFRGFNIR